MVVWIIDYVKVLSTRGPDNPTIYYHNMQVIALSKLCDKRFIDDSRRQLYSEPGLVGLKRGQRDKQITAAKWAHNRDTTVPEW